MTKTDNNSQDQEPKTSRLAVAALVCALLGPLSPYLAPLLYLGEAVFGPLLSLFFFAACLFGLLLGITSLRHIRTSNGRLTGKECAIAAIVISLVWILITFGGVVFPAAMKEIEISRRIGCGTNLSNLGKALHKYADGHDGKYPTANNWCDLLLNGDYITKSQLKCPTDKKGPSSYSLNKDTAGANRADIPGDVVLLFESKPGWNHTGGAQLLAPQNHRGEGCHILFNDGHVEFERIREFDILKWKVEELNTIE